MSNKQKETIPKRKLGKTTIDITPIGQGVMQFAGGTTFMKFMYPALTDEQSNNIVKTALDNGINWFDTAEAYGFGLSEEKLSKGLKAANVDDKDVIIATKWMPMMRRAKSIKKTIQNRIKHLEPYSIDLHQIHMPYSFSSFQKQFDAMAEILDEGHIKSIGISNFSAKQMIKAHDILSEKGLVLASNQVNYSLIKRKIERNGVLDAAKELGVTIISWSPLQSGILSGKYHKDEQLFNALPYARKMRSKKQIRDSQDLINTLDSVADSHKATIAQIALNWLVNYHGDTVVAIPGATKASQAESNGKAMSINLTKTELNEIEEKSSMFI
ncbi:MAG: aldo/keto reductase [Candidatus Heimdallarchaeota archaeon]|nr:aldo/keto reductase [Candidatus Heimdallarchaeota archaeon]